MEPHSRRWNGPPSDTLSQNRTATRTMTAGAGAKKSRTSDVAPTPRITASSAGERGPSRPAKAPSRLATKGAAASADTAATADTTAGVDVPESGEATSPKAEPAEAASLLAAVQARQPSAEQPAAVAPERPSSVADPISMPAAAVKFPCLALVGWVPRRMPKMNSENAAM